jgi:hypothetical protein
MAPAMSSLVFIAIAGRRAAGAFSSAKRRTGSSVTSGGAAIGSRGPVGGGDPDVGGSGAGCFALATISLTRAVAVASRS